MWVHKLLERDRESMLGLCIQCGPVQLVNKSGGRVACKTAKKEQRGRKTPYWKGAHGLTNKQANEMKKDAVCAICGSKEKLCVDHCHETGRIRGVLCHGCNVGIGFLKDDPTLLRQAIEHLSQ